MVDFTQRIASTSGAAITEILGGLLDEAIAAKAKKEYEAGRGSGVGDVAAKRIGAGYIGTDCARELGFRFHKYPKEDRDGPVSKGELNRHAEAGHWTEAKTAEWFGLVGLTVETFQRSKETGLPLMGPEGKPKQIGWMAARDPQTSQYRMAGEVDGVITHVSNGVLEPLIKTPCIWESKKATDKKWKKFSKEGVKKADPKYYGQLQTNMAYLGAEQTLFSMLNLDNMKYFFEIIPFNQADAQAISDRAVKVLESADPFELPRIGLSEDDFRCKFCDFHGQCWKGLKLQPAPTFQNTEVAVPLPGIPKQHARVFTPSFHINKGN